VSRLVLMGSGETAPAMVKTHRAVLESTASGSALMLDTPFGFQVNADDLTARTLRYFVESVGRTVEVARWRTSTDPERERTLARLSEASWLFAGPGSPTYALTQWRDTPLPGAMGDLIDRGGTVVLGSAAAVAAGRRALPVYEIYKVGLDPFWADGLDLLSRFIDHDVAVIPHFDNAEGGTYDTRFCYLGESRLQQMEALLDDRAAVLGVDEHTAVVIDRVAGIVEVTGAGQLTVRRHGHSEHLPTGSRVTIDELRSILSGRSHAAADPVGIESAEPDDERAAPPPSLDAEVETYRRDFDEAMAERDVDRAVSAVLGLDQAVGSWAADTLQSDASDRARRELRAMIVRLGELARVGAADPRNLVQPLVDAVLAARSAAKERRDFTVSDQLRDALAAGGVTVQDTPDGVVWTLDAPDGKTPGTPT
jgi:cyanophycinase-like exopeptidase